MLNLKQAPKNVQKCGRCSKTFDIADYSTKIQNGEEVPLKKCDPCRKKHAASAHTSVNDAAVRKRFNDSAKGKARDKRRKTSAVGKATIKRNKASAKGQSANKRSKTSAAGLALRKREKETKRRRRACDPAFALKNAVLCSAAHLVSGESVTSPTFVERTGFDSESEFLDLIRVSANTLGYTMDQHGSVWDIEHAIPQAAYDFSNPEDVKRCWSPDNLRVMSSEDNNAKGVTLIDEVLMQVGANSFPLSWGGILPTHDEKEAFYEECLTPWVPPEGFDFGEEDEDGEEEDSDEEDDEEEDSDGE
jgi:hypothetical protein